MCWERGKEAYSSIWSLYVVYLCGIILLHSVTVCMCHVSTLEGENTGQAVAEAQRCRERQRSQSLLGS